jgi:uncharacterized membrane protein
VKEWLAIASEHAIVVIDALALIVILGGTVEAAIASLRSILPGVSNHERREVWLRYARWLVAGLTFQLAADIIETTITTSWDAIGRIAVIALIRTFLNFFLERDVEEVRLRQREGGAPAQLGEGAAR